MTLLGGIFAKRDKQNRARGAPANLNTPASATSAASISSTIVSSEPDYVFPDKSLPLPGIVYTGPAAASSSKLKLPFRRKYHHQPHAAGSQPGIISLNDGQRISGVVSESGHGLPLPPPKASIFAMYQDRNTNSSPSLPNESTLPYSLSDTTSTISVVHNEPHTASLSTQLSPPLNKKSGGLFSWARERTKSKPSQPPATIAALSTPTPAPGENFNLRAFRHVRSESPAPSAHQLDPDLPLPPARPRPRGDSVASDSSQRISVAAFREAQARRSCANSPVPSFRPPSTDTLGVEINSRKRASTVSTPTANEFLSPPHRSSAAPQLSFRTSRNSSVVDTESDESEDDDDEEVDSDGAPIKPSRKTTVTRRSGARSRSDAGHVVPNVQAQRPDLPRWSKSDNTQLRQPDNDNATAVRARASASTSALTPNDAAHRASIIATANASSVISALEKPLPSRAVNGYDSDTSRSSNSDSEDTPLSALVAPRGPGSSASVSTAASRPRMPAKPLIDIKSLVGSPPILKPVLRHEHSVKVPSNKGKEREVDKDEPFAPPPVISLTPSRLTENPTSVAPYSSATSGPPTRHKKSSSDVGSVPRMSSEPLPDLDDDLMTAIKLVTSFDKARETSPSPTQPFQNMPPPHPAPPPAVERVDNEELLHDDCIVPTPVREYKPPAAFSVTSRPPRPYSVDISQLPSPTSPTTTFSSVAKRSPSPQTSSSPIKSSFVPRSRAATLAQQPHASSHDRSDSSSVVSTSQSSHSSRLPRVPLIKAVPDSPSVKASWGSSKDLYKHKARAPSAPSLADNRVSRPSSSIHVSLAPSMPRMHMSATAPQSQMLMPSRPFAGNTNSLMREQSPAGSSTGDSSSGRGAPFTPRDGSDLGVNTGRRGESDADSTLKARGANARRSTVSFEDDPPLRGRERVKNDVVEEQRRNERRRNEAKAAIELGKIVNGRGPIVHNGSDDDLVHPGQRTSINPMMGVDGAMPGMNSAAWAPWQQQQQLMPGMVPMVPQFNNDPSFFAAHQRAMMIAKQAYQMAVAQHAMAVAGDQWEQNSNIGGGSVYGGGGGSVYGGGGGSMYGGMGGGGMLSVPGMGMPSMMPNQWSTGGSVIFPGRISSSQSEFGGGSRSVYGESFGPSMSSRSGHVPAAYGSPSSTVNAYGGNPRPRAKTGASQPSNLQSQTPGRSPARKIAPPSSWKNAR